MCRVVYAFLKCLNDVAWMVPCLARWLPLHACILALELTLFMMCFCPWFTSHCNADRVLLCFCVADYYAESPSPRRPAEVSFVRCHFVHCSFWQHPLFMSCIVLLHVAHDKRLQTPNKSADIEMVWSVLSYKSLSTLSRIACSGH